MKSDMMVNGIKVQGVGMEPDTRCKHYHSPLDVIAIRFACCNTYYPCYECNKELADHPAQTILRENFSEPAILCGVCGIEHSVHAYLASNSICPNCSAEFNAGCATHYHLYFDI